MNSTRFFSTTINAAKAAKATKSKAIPVKRASSAFVHFSNDIRPALMKENPTAKIVDLAKIIASQWKELTEVQKKPYVSKFEADRARYDTEMAAYNKTLPPKKSPTAYALFIKDNSKRVSEANPSAQQTEIFKLLAQEWKSADQTKYQAQAQEHKAKYAQELEAWKAKQ